MASRPRRSFNASSQLSKRRAAQASIRNSPAAAVGNDIRNRINLAARRAAAEIMNQLAEKGPAYSGKFRDSWRAIPAGSGASGNRGGKYPYQTSDVPSLSKSLKEVRRATVFTIENIAEYAAVALDLESPDEAPFYVNPGIDPIGGIEAGVIKGRRYGAIRGQVRKFNADDYRQMKEDRKVGASVRPPNISTAKLNWYTNYMRGGQVDKEIERAFKFAFSASSRPAQTYEQFQATRNQ